MFRRMLGTPHSAAEARKFGRAWKAWVAQQHGSVQQGRASPNGGAGASAGPRWEGASWSWDDFATGGAAGAASSWEGFFEATREQHRRHRFDEGWGDEWPHSWQQQQQQQQQEEQHIRADCEGSRGQLQNSLRLLGLSAAAPLTSKALKDAFKAAALHHHPDRHACSPPAERQAAEARFKQVHAAFQVLQAFVVG